MSVTKKQASVRRKDEGGSVAELKRGAALVIHAVALVLAKTEAVTVCSVTQSSDIKVTVQILSHIANCHLNNTSCCNDVVNVAGTCQAQR